MASQGMQRAAREVKPILSLDRDEARKRVLNLYKAWYRQIPYLVRQYDIPRTVEQCKTKLREEFTKYEEIKDVRLVDMMVIKLLPNPFAQSVLKSA
ncbi:unnamed protein product [Acanthoscelides obtectus]|uniref:NADH dehydrogenase [ubiquinone] 1 alpha subcomplex subunit 6 n=1 Tax=Acanthoscelides obtectus TaxID=200917 RepID=A0A9P0K3J4_ACAOB|nr:unnamed protein product [Acanthoscelides obtectus]CAK1622641.1 NADH dehydrogenase [ubiquinone] 1 alpha subcomplex subunit 6 [Acanthoscelides obtectus]